MTDLKLDFVAIDGAGTVQDGTYIYTWKSITYGNNLYVAVGFNNVTYYGAVMISSDGIK